jgi:hypothetical protein
MITKFHGIDKHKKYSTISLPNHKGEEVEFKQKCYDLKEYVDNLGPEDAVIIESSTGAFSRADQVESRGSLGYVLDPCKFKIIRNSWNKTDKQDGVPRRPPFLWVKVPRWQLPVQPSSEECM